MSFLFGSISVLILFLTALLIGFQPELGFKVLWSGIVPAAPLLFLLVTNYWVSLCPFAFLQSLPHRLGFGGTRRLSDKTALRLNYAAWILLFALVPLRHLLFDRVEWAAVAAIVGIGALSVASGWLFQGLSGWCNSLCPVRPVELLYGQSSFATGLPTHCSPCSSCVSNCSRINKIGWIKTPGVSHLAYAFPGFVTAFFLSSGLSSQGEIYVLHAAGALASGLVLGSARLFVSHRTVLRVSAILAISIYYGFTIPKIAAAWGF